MAWGLRGGARGSLRDLTASVFTLSYLPLMAVFVALMLSTPDGARRALVFVILTASSDVGGYFSGTLVGRHKMAPAIRPHKTSEGFARSLPACLAPRATPPPPPPHGHVSHGLLPGSP